MDFGSLNIDNLENIINSLSQSDIDQLSELAETFMGTSGEEKKESSSHKSQPQQGFDFDPQMLAKIMKIMNKLSKQRDDPRCDLLRALRPMLSPEKQRKTDEAINMLRIFSLLPLIDELKG
ncbi:MAG: hypothetical protein IJW86_03250 [Clostridia bacterium]|nr:hypothetical protein [Clostridia bacterium]